MAAIKSFTSLEQSKKLAEILPLESADMYYSNHSLENYYSPIPLIGKCSEMHDQIPCWSFAALFSVLPKMGSEEPIIEKFYYGNNPTERYICQYSLTNMTSEYNNPVDACYEMIIKLHELNLL